MGDPYRDRWAKYGVNVDSLRPKKPTAEDKQDEQGRDFWSFIGELAPAGGAVLGGAIGGLAGGLPTGGVGAIPGIAAGSAIGGGIGQMVGKGASAYGDSLVGEREDEEMAKQQRRADIMNVLMGLR